MTHPTDHTRCGTGRVDRELIAEHLEFMAGWYPPAVFAEDGHAPDAIAGTALRTVLVNEAERLRSLS